MVCIAFSTIKVKMGIKKFFGKVWNGLKKAGRWVKDKALPVIGRVAKPILNVLGMLPGHLGVVGKVGSAVAGIASNIIDKIPNQNVRDKLHGIVDKTNNAFQAGVDKGQQITHTANDIINTAKEGVGRIGGMIKPAVLPPKLHPM